MISPTLASLRGRPKCGLARYLCSLFYEYNEKVRQDWTLLTSPVHSLAAHLDALIRGENVILCTKIEGFLVDCTIMCTILCSLDRLKTAFSYQWRIHESSLLDSLIEPFAFVGIGGPVPMVGW